MRGEEKIRPKKNSTCDSFGFARTDAVDCYQTDCEARTGFLSISQSWSTNANHPAMASTAM